jgi:predicted HTH domain antitoxin
MSGRKALPHLRRGIADDMHMRIEVPDDIVRRAQANAGDLLLALAIELYADNRVDYNDARRLSGITRAQFNKELVSRGLGLHLYPAIGKITKQAG